MTKEAKKPTSKETQYRGFMKRADEDQAELEALEAERAKEITNTDELAAQEAEEAAPLKAEEASWKKRYADLRSFSMKADKARKEEIAELKDSIESIKNSPKEMPLGKEEFKQMLDDNPEIASIVKAMVLEENKSLREDLRSQENDLKSTREELERDTAMSLLLSKHPDFEEINNSEKFADWVAEQPDYVHKILFESSDAQATIREINNFKTDTGWGKKPRRKANSQQSEQDKVAPTRSNAGRDPSQGGPKIWKESEIAALTGAEFEVAMEDIIAAQAEGRVDYDMQNRR